MVERTDAQRLQAQLNVEADLFYLLRDERDHLVREVERLTAEGVAASERRDYYKARCEQMERDHAETVAELERLRAELAETQRSKDEVGFWLDETIESRRKERERAQRAEAKVHAVQTVRLWKNEDGKRFLFADDVYAALRGGETP